MDLEGPFTEEEIWYIVKDLGTNTAPGPYGLSAEFFRKYWNILKVDIKRLFQDFYEKQSSMQA